MGDGAGAQHLKQLAGDDLHQRIFLTGPVPVEQVLDSMAAFDIASLPQSVDGVGSFRYTTKISEYVSARLPVITGRIPLAYDLGSGWVVRLRGDLPWGDEYIDALAGVMNTITPEFIEAKRAALPAHLEAFDREAQVARVTAFIADLLERKAP